MAKLHNLVGASVVVERAEGADSFLLIKQTKGYRAGLFDTPGGKLDPGETLQECGVRETREESGLHVVLGGLITVFHRLSPQGHNHIGFIFAAESYTGDPMPTDPHPEVGFYPFDEIVDMDQAGLLRDSTILASIQLYKEGMQLPDSAIQDFR